MRPVEDGSAKSGTRTITSKLQLKSYDDNNEQTSSTMFHPGDDEGPSGKWSAAKAGKHPRWTTGWRATTRFRLVRQWSL